MYTFPLRKLVRIPHDGPNSFGAQRKHDIHTGVDLITESGEPVYAMEDGVITSIGYFTGQYNGTPWWNDTQYVLIAGASGVILYGELSHYYELEVGDPITAGDYIGSIIPVLKVDKGLPMSMLHIELYKPGYVGSGVTWINGRPDQLLDITPLLQQAYNRMQNQSIKEALKTVVLPTSEETAKKLRQNDPTNMKLYHASNHKFSWPTYKMILENRQNHANGLLGLWCSPDPSWIESFGTHIYEVVLHGDAKIHHITINELSWMAKRLDFDYARYREQLIDAGYVAIALHEQNDSISMYIVMDFNDIGDGLVSFSNINK